MTAFSRPSVLQKTASVTLSKPVQIALYMLLSSLVIWTVFFSTYPAAHNTTHSLRHHTLGVACH
ncbi:CbtB-domain containing protein [Aetokthonos hydrillicola Thurmond2011]|uniref:CbtB-domain containing protein n=1 Tax=Aetokthonos hydrillicola Thurmond2011 TaxID=2712845 RepID=A0AAP5I6T7_9CYAN|nr:CbtB-domain containing protein [Aetokthonos hydrillicola]MBW4586752.1 CbtB-domain containing protein [Aetokthonos hydrillicola CCALA 1050]MDR9895891.1 CbtB-domain containing protein [Aetokthonos hydrillicola Thurmond2011]